MRGRRKPGHLYFTRFSLTLETTDINPIILLSFQAYQFLVCNTEREPKPLPSQYFRKPLALSLLAVHYKFPQILDHCYIYQLLPSIIFQSRQVPCPIFS
jgi:hypothetical protein